MSEFCSSKRILLLIFPAIIILTGMVYCADKNADSLKSGFIQPPPSAQMRVFWWWLESNITKAGITRDLEEMREKGIGGALLYDGGSSSYQVANRTPAGPPFFSPQWRALYKYALKEAHRLGLEITLNAGGSGWNIGGPWVTPEYAAQKLVFSETKVAGPVAFSDTLPMPSGVIKDSLGETIYYRDVAVLAYRIRKDLPVSRVPIKNWAVKTVNTLPGEGTIWASILEQAPSSSGDIDVHSDSLIDLSHSMDNTGCLNWTFPTGDWTILRFGYTITGRQQSTASPGGHGLMIDPLNPRAMEMHFNTLVDRLVEDAGPLAGNTLKYFFIDSWEEGAVNWATEFPEEFAKRRGYNILPYLPVLAGKIVDTREISNRFLYDFRRTIADCISDYYYGRFQELSHSHGILCNPEAGGPHPAPLDALQCLGRTDVPMGEFWARANTHRVEDWRRIFVKQSASAAHIYSKNLVAMEAFTTLGPHWEKDPWGLKPTADRAFCEGANQFFKVSFTHSPVDAGKPGYEFFAGTHFNPNITWWEQARPWTDYIARCQYLLQQGMFVADVCYYYGDHVPNFVPLKRVEPSLGPGYDYDMTNTEVILSRMTVQDGRIVLPDGMRYRLLVLPDLDSMPLAVLRRIAELVQAGATVVGPKPVRAPGLENYPECDRNVKELADVLWGPCDGQTIQQHTYGKGRIFWGKPLREILLSDSIPPDFEYNGTRDDCFLDYIHRTTGDAEVYFIANRREQWSEARCTFRVQDRVPELWYPDTGAIEELVRYTVNGGRTTVPLRLAPHGSVFVVFRHAPTREPVVRLLRNGQEVGTQPGASVDVLPQVTLIAAGKERLDLRAWQPGEYTVERADGQAVDVEIASVPAPQPIMGPWEVRFPAGWGAPDSVLLDTLQSWAESADPGVKYFSGTATYQKAVTIPATWVEEDKSIWLDLGRVRNLAEVRINGQSLGILWKRPFRVEITGVLRAGVNDLEIAVTNLWPNRLIGDQFLPEAQRYAQTNVVKFTRESPLLESGLLGPVQLYTAVKKTVEL